VDTLACLDIFSLLMPGSDGTARAVREAMAMAKPCVVSDYYMLPEIVEHGKAGFVVPDDPELLAQAWLTLIQDTKLREKMGLTARQHALERFRTDAVGPVLEEFYQRILKLKKGANRL
jgi:glycosyltransferase involved in cell wall biosynthesis